MKNVHPRRIQSHHLILILELNPFSDAMIPAKGFLIQIGLFVDQNSSQIVTADQRAYEQTGYLSQKPLHHQCIGLFL